MWPTKDSSTRNIFKVVLLLLNLFIACGSKTDTKSLAVSTKTASKLSSQNTDHTTAESRSSYAVNTIPALPLVVLSPVNDKRAHGTNSEWYGFNKYVTRSEKSAPMKLDSYQQSSQSYRNGGAMYRNPNYQERSRNFYTNANPNHGFQNSYGQQHSSDYSGGGSYNRGHNSPQEYQRRSVPVVIRIIPLELTSQYIQEALKTMRFIPLPLSVLNHSQRKVSPAEQYATVDYRATSRYADAGGHESFGYGEYSPYSNSVQQESEVEPELPRPSSHVATPQQNQMDIVYDDEDERSYYRAYTRES